MSPKTEQSERKPGADRFWGQFSQSKAGRTRNGTELDSDPGAGTDSGPNDETSQDAHCLEWCPICRSAELFHTVSPELRQQADSIQHEAMGVLKSFLDAYAEKAAREQGPSTPGNRGSTAPGSGPGARHDEPEDPASPRVTDIPLD